jgi:hypothetical protein
MVDFMNPALGYGSAAGSFEQPVPPAMKPESKLPKTFLSDHGNRHSLIDPPAHLQSIQP